MEVVLFPLTFPTEAPVQSLGLQGSFVPRGHGAGDKGVCSSSLPPVPPQQTPAGQKPAPGDPRDGLSAPAAPLPAAHPLPVDWPRRFTACCLLHTR